MILPSLSIEELLTYATRWHRDNIKAGFKQNILAPGKDGNNPSGNCAKQQGKILNVDFDVLCCNPRCFFSSSLMYSLWSMVCGAPHLITISPFLIDLGDF